VTAAVPQIGGYCATRAKGDSCNCATGCVNWIEAIPQDSGDDPTFQKWWTEHRSDDWGCAVPRATAFNIWLGVEAALASEASPVAVAEPPYRWLPIASAPRDGSNIMIRFGTDGVSQAKYIAGTPHPWKFIDTNDGITWLVNHAVDNEYGPTHWMPMPDVRSPEPGTVATTLAPRVTPDEAERLS
jgi:hypothetical protein